MTTKTVDRVQDSETSKAKPAPEELEIAYRIHTLSQIIHGHLAMTHQNPWIGAPLPVTAFWPQLQPQPTPWIGSRQAAPGQIPEPAGFGAAPFVIGMPMFPH